MSITDDVKEFYTKTPFPCSTDIKFYRNLFNQCVERVEVPTRENCLVVGCGTTQPYNIALINDAKKYTFCDLSETSLGLANDMIGSNNHNWVCSDIVDYETNDKYDIIYSTCMIHHCDKPKEILEKLRSLASENAVLNVTLYNKDSELREGIRPIATEEGRRWFDMKFSVNEVKDFLQYKRLRNVSVNSWLNYHRNSDGEIMDTWAHPYYVDYSLSEAVEILNKTGWKVHNNTLNDIKTQISLVCALG